MSELCSTGKLLSMFLPIGFVKVAEQSQPVSKEPCGNNETLTVRTKKSHKEVGIQSGKRKLQADFISAPQITQVLCTEAHCKDNLG